MTKQRLSDIDLRALINSVRHACGGSPALPFGDEVLDCLRELQERRIEVEKYKAWAASCDPSPAIQAVIAELEALRPPVTDSGLEWVRVHCLGLLRGQLPVEPSADAREDRSYYNGARQAAAMAHQSLDAMDDWIEGGCGGRGPRANV